MSAILVVNSGSSSFKYQLIDVATEDVLASGLVERIGEDLGSALGLEMPGWTIMRGPAPVGETAKPRVHAVEPGDR